MKLGIVWQDVRFPDDNTEPTGTVTTRKGNEQEQGTFQCEQEGERVAPSRKKRKLQVEGPS